MNEQSSMIDLQKQVKPRTNVQGQPLPGPRLAQPRPTAQRKPAPLISGVVKQAAKKWAPFALPLISGGIGGLTAYFIS